MIEGETLASELIKCAKCSWRFLLFNSSATLTYFYIISLCIVLSAFRHYIQLPVTLSLDFLSLWAQFISLLLYFCGRDDLCALKNSEKPDFSTLEKAFISARSARKFFAAYQIERRKNSRPRREWFMWTYVDGWWGKTSPNITEGLMSLALIHSEEERNQEEIVSIFNFVQASKSVFFECFLWSFDGSSSTTWTELESQQCVFYFSSLTQRTIYVAIKKCVTR